MMRRLLTIGCGLLWALVTGCDLGGSKPAELRVVTTPEGAEIFCDQTLRDKAPCAISELLPGDYLIQAKLDGYREARKSVTLTAGQVLLVEVNLDPIEGLVLLHSVPSEASVEIDGAFRGKTPLMIDNFPLGQHRVKLQREGYMDREIEVTVENRIPQKIDVTLESDSAAMQFDSQPPGATVLIDGVSRGVTPCRIADVPTGASKVEFRLAGHYPHTEEINLRAGDAREMAAALKPIPGQLNVFSVPEGTGSPSGLRTYGMKGTVADAPPAGVVLIIR